MKPLCAILGMLGLLMVPGPVLAKEQTVTLTVENMTCSLCPVTVRKVLQAVEGVHEANISLEQNKAVITFDDGQTDVETLITATTNAGFPSALAQEDERYDD
ncbi:MAG: periplasmic mercury ion-binding protein [Nitrospirales bacterium]|nr:MAG: periplasmic mercury ion-binding protein [Nitrospirales bacterium]